MFDKKFISFIILIASFLAFSSSVYCQYQVANYLGTRSSEPNCQRKGQVYFNTSDNTAYVCSATGTPGTWDPMTGGGGGGGDMTLADVQTVTGAKTFNSSKLILAGATSGTTVLNAAAEAGTTTVTLPATTGTVALTANKLSVFASTSSAELAGVISDETGSGALVFGTSPSLTTPSLGAATATSITASDSLNLANNKFLKGARTDSGSINLIGLNDSNLVIVGDSTSAAYLSVDGTGAVVTIGDGADSSNSVRLIVDDNAGEIKVQNAYLNIGTGRIVDINSNTLLNFITTADADDYVVITNHTSNPVISTAGADTNIPLTISTKGTGDLNLTSPRTVFSGQGYIRNASDTWLDLGTAGNSLISFGQAGGVFAGNYFRQQIFAANGLGFSHNTGAATVGFWSPSSGLLEVWDGVGSGSYWRDLKLRALYSQTGSNSVFVKSGGIYHNDTTPVGNVGAGEDDLQAKTIEAGVLSADGQSLEVEIAITFANNTNNKRIKIDVGSTVVLDTAATPFEAGIMTVNFRITRTGATTQRVQGVGIVSSTLAAAPLNVSFGINVTTSETLSGTFVIKATGEATDDNDIVQNQLLIKFDPAP